MTNFLQLMPKLKSANRKAKRVGRGAGSGKGMHTIGKGNKGQNARSGGKVPLWFEGGQTPITLRLPFRGGFRNPNSKDVVAFNLKDIAELDLKDKEITPEKVAKKAKYKLGPKTIVKILGRGDITAKVNFKGFVYSGKAKEKIEAAGGVAS